MEIPLLTKEEITSAREELFNQFRDGEIDIERLIYLASNDTLLLIKCLELLSFKKYGARKIKVIVNHAIKTRNKEVLAVIKEKLKEEKVMINITFTEKSYGDKIAAIKGIRLDSKNKEDFTWYVKELLEIDNPKSPTFK